MGLAQRRKARTLLVQVFYQWQYAKGSFILFMEEFHEKNADKSYDKVYFDEIMMDLDQSMDNIEQVVNDFIRKKVAHISNLMLAIARLTIYELKYRLDVPVNVIVDEGVKNAKIFGNEEETRTIHAILIELVQHLRPDSL